MHQPCFTAQSCELFSLTQILNPGFNRGVESDASDAPQDQNPRDGDTAEQRFLFILYVYNM